MGYIFWQEKKMVFNSSIFLLFSNSAGERRDLSVTFNKICSLSLWYSGLLVIVNFIKSRGIGLQSGLLFTTNITEAFQFFIFLLSMLILQLTGFFPRVLWVPNYSSWFKRLFFYFVFYNTKVIKKMSEQFKILEYPLIILFIITGAIFLMSGNDLISIFLAVELQSYGLYLLCSVYRNSELATAGGLIYFLIGNYSAYNRQTPGTL